MSSDSGSPPSYHLFYAPTVSDGTPMALGRAHGSWFLITAHPQLPHGLLVGREQYCLNFIVPKSSPITAISPWDVVIASGSAYPSSAHASKPRFTIGGSSGKEILDTLLSLRSADGRPPVQVVHNLADAVSSAETEELKLYAKAYDLCAVVEVDVPPDGVFHACARCGMWETMYAPRFLRCSVCKSRFYCSAHCQKADWKAAYHKGECPLLREGKFEEVEARRNLHNNGWWFETSHIGPAWLAIGHAEEDWNRAMKDNDFVFLAYGRPSPPRDAPPGTRPPRPPIPHPQPGITQYSIPPGFVRTGHNSLDRHVIERYRLLVSGEINYSDDSKLPPPSTRFIPFTNANIPPLPVLPDTPGPELTGDPLVDEALALAWGTRYGNEESLFEVREAISSRQLVRHEREKLFEARSVVAGRRWNAERNF